MNRFWDLLEKSTLVSGFIAVSFTAAIVYLSITGRPIPDLLGNAALIIVGFFFGAKSNQSAISALQSDLRSYHERSSEDQE